MYELSYTLMEYLTFVSEEIVCHVHRLLVGNPESVIQDRFPEVPRHMVVADAFRDGVVPVGKTCTTYPPTTAPHTTRASKLHTSRRIEFVGYHPVANEKMCFEQHHPYLQSTKRTSHCRKVVRWAKAACAQKMPFPHSF